MKALGKGAAAAAGLLMVVLSTVVRATPAPDLTVRLYNTSGISAAQLVDAQRAAVSVLQDAGLTVAFRHCRGRTPGATDPCADRPGSREVVVRILEAPAFNTTLPLGAFGVAYVVKESNHGWLATVFSDRIGSAAARANVNPGSLLGFVMAHEVGHLLLGVDYHGVSGVMRAEWEDPLLHQTKEQWRFSSAEAERLRQAAASLF